MDMCERSSKWMSLLWNISWIKSRWKGWGDSYLTLDPIPTQPQVIHTKHLCKKYPVEWFVYYDALTDEHTVKSDLIKGEKYINACKETGVCWFWVTHP